MGQMRWVHIVVLFACMPRAEAGRRKHSLPPDPLPDVRADHGERLLVGMGMGMAFGHSPIAASQLHYFVRDTLTLGARLRMPIVEGTVGISLLTVTPARHARLDIVGIGGLGVSPLGPLVSAAAAARVHPRVKNRYANYIGYELAVRTSAIDQAEVTLSLLLTWPPVQPHRSCRGTYWD
jgi:hypothetical protein